MSYPVAMATPIARKISLKARDLIPKGEISHSSHCQPLLVTSRAGECLCSSWKEPALISFISERLGFYFCLPLEAMIRFILRKVVRSSNPPPGAAHADWKLLTRSKANSTITNSFQFNRSHDLESSNMYRSLTPVQCDNRRHTHTGLGES